MPIAPMVANASIGAPSAPLIAYALDDLHAIVQLEPLRTEERAARNIGVAPVSGYLSGSTCLVGTYFGVPLTEHPHA